MILPLLLVAGAAAVAAATLWPRRARAGGSGLEANPYQPASWDALTAQWLGRTIAELDRAPADRAAIIAHNRELAGPPPKDGPLGTMLLPDRLRSGAPWTPPDILVRRKAEERARDLGWAFGSDFTWASPEARLRTVQVRGQKDWSLAGELKRGLKAVQPFISAGANVVAPGSGSFIPK